MLFGSKTPLYTSVEIIDTILSDGTLLNKQGSVVIKRKDKRKTVQTGIIYFRGSDVYAASVSDKPIPIAQRVITGGMTEEESVRRIAKLAGGGHSPDVVRQVLVSNLVTESLMDEYVKEHFLENVAEILSWENCVGEWVRDGKTKDFTMPNVPFTKLKAIILSREVKKNDFAKELSRFFKPEEFKDICPVNRVKKDTSFANEIQALLENSNGENTFEDISNITGIGKTVVIQTFHKLWIKGIVSLKLQAIDLTYEASQKAKKKNEEVKTVEEFKPQTLDLNTALSETPKTEKETVETPETIDEALPSAEEIEEVKHNSDYENEEFNTESDDYEDDDTALINGDTSIIEVIKKANATDFDIPQTYEVLEAPESDIEPSTLEDGAVAQSEDDLDEKMQQIYKRYGFERTEKITSNQESEANMETNKANEFDTTANDEVLAEFDRSEEIDPVDEVVTETDEDRYDDAESAESDSGDSDNGTFVDVEDSSSVSNQEHESNAESDSHDSESDEEQEEQATPVAEPLEDEEFVDRGTEDGEDSSIDNMNAEQDPEEQAENSENTFSSEQYDQLEKIVLPESISNIDFSVEEVNNLPELMTRLSKLQEADNLIDSEIEEQERLEGVSETEAVEYSNLYTEFDQMLRDKEQDAKQILDAYNTKIQEIENLAPELDKIREQYELSNEEMSRRTALISELQLKKEEVAQVIRQITLQFSSKS